MNSEAHTTQEITLTHIELGLYEVSRLMKENMDVLPQAFDLISRHIISKDKHSLIRRVLDNSNLNAKGKVLVFCGYEIEMLDYFALKFQNVIVVPNDIDVDVERIKANYAKHPNFQVFRPTKTADIVSPDTIIMVPLYPLQDGTLLAYNYPSKLLTKEIKASSYKIIGIEVCSALPLQYEYDFSGISSVLSPVNPENITHLIEF